MKADSEQFVCEQLEPEKATGDTAAMTHGCPGLPASFTWRGTRYEVAGVIEQWKTHGPCKSGAAERYLRRHWYKILTQPHAIMTVYFDRQAKDRKHPKARWFLYTISEQEDVV